MAHRGPPGGGVCSAWSSLLQPLAASPPSAPPGGAEGLLDKAEGRGGEEPWPCGVSAGRGLTKPTRPRERPKEASRGPEGGTASCSRGTAGSERTSGICGAGWELGAGGRAPRFSLRSPRHSLLAHPLWAWLFTHTPGSMLRTHQKSRPAAAGPWLQSASRCQR